MSRGDQFGSMVGVFCARMNRTQSSGQKIPLYPSVTILRRHFALNPITLERGRRGQGVEAPAKASVKRARLVAVGTATGAVNVAGRVVAWWRIWRCRSALTKAAGEEDEKKAARGATPRWKQGNRI